MAINEHGQNRWLLFYLIIIFMGIVTWLIHRIYPNPGGPPLQISITYYILHIIVVFAFLYHFKFQDIIFKSIYLNRKEIVSSTIVIALWLIPITVHNPIIIPTFLNGFKWHIVLPIMAEELFFRIFILGTLVYSLSLKFYSYNKFPYIGFFFGDINDKNSFCKILIAITVSSFLFSLWHEEIIGTRLIKGFFIYGLTFILTNKKIMPSFLLHYCNNILSEVK